MNSRPFDSQISAWFDNELTPGKRAEVERRLQQSSAARDELAEVEAISSWIAELPPAALPRDFANQIVAAVTANEAKAAAGSEPVLRAAEPASAAGPMRWTRGLGVLISAAAVLVVAVTLMNRPSAMNKPFDSSVASADAERSESPLHADRLSRLQAEGGAGVLFALQPAAANKAAADREDADRIEKQMPLAMGRARNALPGEFKFDVDLNRVVVGQDVDARVLRSGGQVAVVRLTVVDRVEGLKNLQVLLTGKPIARDGAMVGGVRSGDAAAKAKPAEAKSGQDDYLVAVYVEASEQQLSAVLDQIRRDARFESMQIDQPIAAEQLAMATTEPIGKNSQSERFKLNAAVPAARLKAIRVLSEPATKREVTTRRRLENEPTKRKLGRKPGDVPNDGSEKAPATEDEGLVQEELARVSRQLPIRLPREMLSNRSQPAAPAADKPADDVADKQTERDPKVSAAEGAKSRAAERPLQVIFVLDVVPERGEGQ